jgi:hypothetical protein
MPCSAVTPVGVRIHDSGQHGYGVDDPADGTGLGAGGVVDSDPLGVGELVDVGEPVGVGERLGVREGLGDSVGLWAYRVGLGDGVGGTTGWGASTDTGRTMM